MLNGSRPLLFRYSVAVLAVAVAFALTVLLRPVLDPTVFALFFAAVMVSAWYGSLGPGLLATFLAVLIVDLFLLRIGGPNPVAVHSFLRLAIFVLVALLISSLTAARQRAEEALRKAHDQLEMRVQERTTELAQTNDALKEEISERKRAEDEKQKLLHNLHKRVKELTALHKTARLLQQEQPLTAELLQEIATLLPSAWQYPEVTAAHIRVDGVSYATPNFAPTAWKQCADFLTLGGKDGLVEVVYLVERPPAQEGPFLAEERNLLISLTELLKSYFERKEAEAQVAQVTQELVERNKELWRLQREMGRVEPLAALGRITATIAHELGTPLNTVLGYSQLLAQEPLSENARECLSIVEKQIQRMVEIIHYYLSQTRSSARKHHQVNVNGLLRETLLLVEPIFRQHRVQVNTTLAEALPLSTADGVSLQRVFINIINNAVDAMENGGTLTLVTRAAGPPQTAQRGVIVEISDTGSGIPPEILPKIFDLFVTTKTAGKGTGLGLAVCQEIIKVHGGMIDISSQVGQGTCVRIFLPAEDEDFDKFSVRPEDRA